MICPTAPVIPITLNLGFRMPAWFDIESLENLEEEPDIAGLQRSAQLVYKHIEGEIRFGIPSDKIIIGGFSQGEHTNLIFFHLTKKVKDFITRGGSGAVLRHALPQATGRLRGPLHLLAREEVAGPLHHPQQRSVTPANCMLPTAPLSRHPLLPSTRGERPYPAAHLRNQH